MKRADIMMTPSDSSSSPEVETAAKLTAASRQPGPQMSDWIDQASKRRLPIVIINRGVTKGDTRATVKIDAGTSETIGAIASRLGS